MGLTAITLIAWVQLITAGVDNDGMSNYLFKTIRHVAPSGTYMIAWSQKDIISMKLQTWRKIKVKMLCHDAHKYQQHGESTFPVKIKICTATELTLL